jgi:hypothetical protein
VIWKLCLLPLDSGLTLPLFSKHAARTLFKVSVALVIRRRLEQLELEQVLHSKSFRLPWRHSETFHHPNVEVPDFSARYGKVAAVR